MLLAAAALAAAFLARPITAAEPGQGTEGLQLVEATVSQLHHAMKAGLVTPEQLVRMYRARIDAYDKAGPRVNAFLYVNPNAEAQARALGEQREGEFSRPLYGIPVLLKDNIDTADMPTTAGSVALAGSIPPSDAFITRRLRQAGAVILGKATLTEFANFLAVGMPTGYSSLGGFGLNPYDPRVLLGGDGRPVLQTGGSSSGPGIGVNANLATLAVGTETSGSILSPASSNGVVGIKPTLGLVSRHGIIPITADQDTAGPIARTVTDAALLLGVLAGYDPDDPATAACLTPGNCFRDYTLFLDRKALKGARIAVVTPIPSNRAAIMSSAIEVLRALGAYVELLPSPFPAQPGSCVSYPPPAGCSTVLMYGQKHDLNAYLAARPGVPRKTIAEIVAFNSAYKPPMKYGQAIFEAAQRLDVTPGSADTLRYQVDLAEDRARSRGALDAVYKGPDGIKGTADDFDAILSSANNFAAAPAKAGYPSVTVPGGFVPPVPPIENPFPSGVTFSGPAFSEPALIGFAYAFEQATLLRQPPASTPPLPTDSVSRPGLGPAQQW
ncbi:MAG TPA: amidase family protein [Thermoanaerobaculia bacterium]|jgi:amidase|nr:amidase family protein [Thermoanaerobaculia bacterium]